MKRILAILLAAILLAASGAALAEELSQTFTTAYYTLSLPQDWTIDTSDLQNEQDYEDFGVMYAPDDPSLTIEAGMSYYSDMKDVSLWNADEAQLQDYIEDVKAELSDYGGEYVSTLRAGNIPFVVFHASDGDGPYYYVDTMTNGYAICFYVYDYGADSGAISDPSEAEWALFERILATFAPIA